MNAKPNNISGKSDTVKFQFEVSKYVLNYLNNSIKINEIGYNTFGTKYGNEVCINYNPIGRKTSDKHYEEYELFFGIKNRKGFPDPEREEKRINIIREFINGKILSGSYIFIYGSNYDKNKLQRILGIDLNFKEYEIIGRETSWCSVDFEKKIWWFYHPSKRSGVHQPLPSEISDFLDPIKSDRIRERKNS